MYSEVFVSVSVFNSLNQFLQKSMGVNFERIRMAFFCSLQIHLKLDLAHTPQSHTR